MPINLIWNTSYHIISSKNRLSMKIGNAMETATNWLIYTWLLIKWRDNFHVCSYNQFFLIECPEGKQLCSMNGVQRCLKDCSCFIVIRMKDVNQVNTDRQYKDT